MYFDITHFKWTEMCQSSEAASLPLRVQYIIYVLSFIGLNVTAGGGRRCESSAT